MTSSTSWPCAALRHAELAPRTTIRVGGRAEWLLEPATPAELAEAHAAARERGERPRVLGGGANLLVADGVLPGVVIATDRLARVYRPGAPRSPEEEAAAFGGALGGAAPEREPVLVAWAGASLPSLVRAARELALSGLEALVGIPGNLGGAVAMNAGGRYGEIWDVVERVSVLTEDGEVVELPREECAPRYRDGGLGGATVLAAALRLAPGERRAIQERMSDILSEKSAAQPVTERSSGCIFRNPDPELSDGRSAGKLVEECGGKGLSRGDAVVSPKHGNFVVNKGRARAADVFALIEDLHRLVADRTGIELEREVKVWRRGDEQ